MLVGKHSYPHFYSVVQHLFVWFSEASIGGGEGEQNQRALPYYFSSSAQRNAVCFFLRIPPKFIVLFPDKKLFKPVPTIDTQKNTLIILFIQSDIRSQLGRPSSKAETSLEQVTQVTPLG